MPYAATEGLKFEGVGILGLPEHRNDQALEISAKSGTLGVGSHNLRPGRGISLLMNNGAAVVRVENESIDYVGVQAVLPGSVIPVMKNDRPRIKLKQPLNILCVEMPPKFMQPFVDITAKIDCIPSASEFRQELTGRFYMHAMRTIWQELGQKNPHKSLLVHGAATALLGCVLSHLDSAKAIPKSSMCAETIIQIAELVESGLDTEMPVEKIARQFGHSKSDFQKHFHAAFGKTFKQYVVERRVLKAKKMSLETDEAFAHIAIDCGFYDQAHMIHTFRRQIGCTPGQIRRQASA